MTRIPLKTLFMKTAFLFAQRGTCLRAQVGAIIVKDGRIISTGYVGSAPGEPHCLDVGCIIDEKTGGCIRTLHAEQNALFFAARNGINISGGELYVTMMPCLSCAKNILLSGIKKVYYWQDYRDIRGIEYLKQHGVEVEQYLVEEEEIKVV